MAWPFFPTPFLRLLSCPVLPTFFPFHSYRILDLSPQVIIIVVLPSTLVFYLESYCISPRVSWITWTHSFPPNSQSPLHGDVKCESVAWSQQNGSLWHGASARLPGPPPPSKIGSSFHVASSGAKSPEQLLSNSVIRIAGVSFLQPTYLGAGCSGTWQDRKQSIPWVPEGDFRKFPLRWGSCEFRVQGLSCLGSSGLGPARALVWEDPKGGRGGSGPLSVQCAPMRMVISLWPGPCPWSHPLQYLSVRWAASHWPPSCEALSEPWLIIVLCLFFSCQVAFRRVRGPIIISSAALSFFGRHT